MPGPSATGLRWPVELGMILARNWESWPWTSASSEFGCLWIEAIQTSCLWNVSETKEQWVVEDLTPYPHIPVVPGFSPLWVTEGSVWALPVITMPRPESRPLAASFETAKLNKSVYSMQVLIDQTIKSPLAPRARFQVVLSGSISCFYVPLEGEANTKVDGMYQCCICCCLQGSRLLIQASEQCVWQHWRLEKSPCNLVEICVKLC